MYLGAIRVGSDVKTRILGVLSVKIGEAERISRKALDALSIHDAHVHGPLESEEADVGIDRVCIVDVVGGSQVAEQLTRVFAEKFAFLEYLALGESVYLLSNDRVSARSRVLERMN